MIFNNDFQIPHKYVIVSVCIKLGNKIFYSTINFFQTKLQISFYYYNVLLNSYNFRANSF